MKKILFKDLEWNRQLELLEKNEKLLNELCEDLMELNYDLQRDMSDEILGSNWHKYIECHDHYNSFFLTLKDYRKFLCNLQKDYLKSENLKLYDVLMKKLDVLDSMNYYSDNYSNLENWIEEKTKILLEDVEENLHGYEDTPSTMDILEDFEINNYFDNDYYILVDEETGKSDDIIRLDVSYTKEFN